MPAETKPISAGQIEFFEEEIRPLLSNHCYSCHSAKAEAKGKLKAGLRLDSLEMMLKGGDSGPALIPRDINSLIIKAVGYLNEDMAMPPKGKLKDREITALKKWVELGAPWPGALLEQLTDTQEDPEPYDWDAFRLNHWSFRPVKKPALPEVIDRNWTQSPIDSFILSKLETTGIKPNDRATKRVLIRRAYLDLIGLPPPPEKVSAFINDQDPVAFARLVDELLESDHYGERWARHWLDVARYSDGHGGFGDNKALPNAWRYRDWVASALNDDIPYNQFVVQQIAGDLIENQKQPIATGFFVVGPTYQSDGGDPEAKAAAQAETLSDRIDTFSRAFLGLTAACARCHDHKFDPITVEDYYALAGIFNNTRNTDRNVGKQVEIDAYQAAQNAINDQNKIINSYLDNESKKLKINRKEVEKKLPDESKSKLAEMRAHLETLKKQLPSKPATAHVLSDSGSADIHVAIRGDLRRKGKKVPRRFLEIISGKEAKLYTTGSGRLQLAQSVTDPDNPLTARVIVNRVWGWHFGEALVRTPSNFGVIGEKPSHPQLLDWLASEFIENGWSLKHLHRKILLSSTWQMSSAYNKEKFNLDGDNRLLWRAPPRKLEVEAWRDTLLAVTGELDRTIGGPPVAEILSSNRRTLYATISRTGDRFRSDAFLRLFDFPAAVSTSAKRSTSTVPQQYLFMMNSSFMNSRAASLGTWLHTQDSEIGHRIELVYNKLYSRPPEAVEKELARDWLGDSPSHEAWNQYAQVLLSAHELIQIP
ncbi:MAG: DUF1549 domain-containing protein [Verrucomicrobiaceae bacterium]|nr:DUF1549 domain-containing protein [Verrucomicrobiaceae bacterium]